MRVVDLFCGCGGLSLGFQKAGFEIVSAYDNWEPAVATYRANFGHHSLLEEITEDTRLPQADIIIGGPPCQGFSSAGLRRPADKRNSLVSVFALLVKKYRPKAFLFENVEGFLTGGSGRFVFDLLEPLMSSGYRVHLRKVNAANYGIPQHRKRVIVIGGLGWDPTFPEVTHSALGAPGAALRNSSARPFAPSVLAALAGLPRPEKNGEIDHQLVEFGKADHERARLLEPGQRMRDLPEEFWHESYRRRANRRVSDGTPTERRGGAPSGLRRLYPHEPSKAITGGALREFVHPWEDRPLTIRECARLQTFPDTFLFEGKRAEKVQQIGNAVPPLLASVFAAALRDDLAMQQNAGTGRGRLLSMTLTGSSGMSPALREVQQLIETRINQRPVPAQGDLWA